MKPSPFPLIPILTILSLFFTAFDLDASTTGDEDTLMGEYRGFLTFVQGGVIPAEAKVYPEGDRQYRAVLLVSGTKPVRLEFVRDVEAPGCLLHGEGLGARWKGKIEKGLLAAKDDPGKVGAFNLIRIVRDAPSAGLKPPPGAKVLLPFTPGEAPTLDAWANKEWKALPDGSMQVARGHNRTVEDHGSGVFHLEFRIPYEPEGRGQGRGNSGIYFTSRYEIQILDSFGLVPGMGDCGSIYGIAITKENACLPPLAWQTYDVIYRAPRTGPDGELVPAVMTVFHNGVMIHENQPVPRPTTAAPGEGNVVLAPLFLQNHGHPVCYRNIWYLPLED